MFTYFQHRMAVLTKKFSGDKDHMILWGQSAGANAVVTYSYGNPDDPIVSALVADSGAATSPGSVVNTTSFTVMAEAFNCTSAVPSEELVCMQRVDPFAIQAWVRNYSSSAFGAPRLGGIVADNVTAWANTTERLMMGRVAKIVSLPSIPFHTHLSKQKLAKIGRN
jgi:carboxylesterase type B